MLNEASFDELLVRHKESGLNVRDFCSNEGIHPSTFYYWLKKHRGKNQPEGFIPLAIQDTFAVAVQRTGKVCGNIKPGSSSAEQGALLEFVFPNGTRVLLKQQPDLAHLYD
jgi:hypothetical protein